MGSGDDLDAVLDGGKGLGVGLASGDTEGHHGSARPLGGDAKGLGDGGSLGGAEAGVVLERGAHALSSESGPDNELSDTGSVASEGGHGAGEHGVALDELVDSDLVLEEDDGAVAGLVSALELALKGLDELLVAAKSTLLSLPYSIPELGVLVAKDDNGTRRLDVVRRRGELDRTLNELLDLLVRDRRLVGEVVVRAAGLDG